MQVIVLSVFLNVFKLVNLLIILVALMSKSDYLIAAQKYEYISRIECTERELRSKSEVEIDALISFLNDKGMA